MGKGGQKSETSKQAPTRKTEAAANRRQNNRMLRQCPSGIAQRPPHHANAVPTAVQNRVTKTMSSSAVGKQPKQKKSNTLCIAQHHLPALVLFWANFFVRVQLTYLLLISPGLCNIALPLSFFPSFGRGVGNAGEGGGVGVGTLQVPRAWII